MFYCMIRAMSECQRHGKERRKSLSMQSGIRRQLFPVEFMIIRLQITVTNYSC